MSNLPDPSSSSSDELPVTLTDRVMARVVDARLALNRRASATRPKSKRRRKVPLASSPSDAQNRNESQEDQSLRQVFRDLGIAYRRYRSQTGEPVTPGLRDAAYRFRAEPSLTSLVAVAAYLDDLDLLS